MQNFLKNATQAGLYSLPASHQARLQKMAKQADLQLRTVELDHFGKLDRILGELGQALHFPDWYGANLDALHDCLTDPEWLPKHGIVIQITGLDHLQQKAPHAFTTLLEVLGSAARERSAAQLPLWILLDTPGHGIAPLPEA
ncbi:MAG: barstar family protein [Azonexus sp.]